MKLHKKQIERIRSIFKNKPIIFANQKNIQWLSGKVDNFGIIVVTDNDQYVFTTEGFAPRFDNKIYEIITVGKKDSGSGELKSDSCLKAAINYLKIKNSFSDFSYKNMKNVLKEILNIRAIKLKEEIEILKKVRYITNKSINYAIENISLNMSEIEIASLVETKMRDMGAECFSFNTIVASGKNSFLTHTTPTKRKIKKNDIVLIDAGAVYNGYCGDLTRTICLGKNKKYDEIYNKLEYINKKILEEIKREIKIKEINNFYKKLLIKLNFKYLHSVCHGIGVDVHEYPSIYSNNKFQIGNVFTIEPGIYIPNKFGIRHEDMYYINTRGECECLN